MDLLSEPAITGWPFPFTPQDWEQTPPAVQAYLHTVHDTLSEVAEVVGEKFFTPLLCFALCGFSVLPSGPISHTLA